MTSAAPVPAAPTAERPRHGRMHLLMLLVTFCWAGNIITGKEALTGFGPLALAQLRLLGAAVIFSALFLAGGKFRTLRLAHRKWLCLVVLAGVGMAINQLTFICGMARSTVAHTGLIVALGPVMVLLIAVVIRLESLTAGKLVGMLIAFGGVGILTVDTAAKAGGHATGDFIQLVSTLVFAVFTVLVKEVTDQFDTLTLNTLIFVLGAATMLPFCVHALWMTPWKSLGFEAWWGLLFMVVFGTVASYLLFAYVMTELAASRVAAFGYLQPVIASGLGVWVLSERLTTKVWIGGTIILAGVYLTERERGETATPARDAMTR